MELTKEIIELRPYLLRVTYNMLGVVEDAEDIVQNVYEKWISVREVKEPKAYLARMCVNKSIDRLNELKKLRENYKGTWLPEPYITLEADPTPSIEYGLLFLMERLNPLERAVFILREGFSEEYHFIAELTELSIDNCRQLLHRAHEKLERNKALPVDAVKQRLLTEAFLTALYQQDRSSLDELLRSDIALFADGGGKRASALKPLFGLEKVLKFLLGIMKLPENQGNEFEYRSAFVNGLPAALIFRRSTGELDAMQYVVLDETGIASLLFVRNPDKLKIQKV